MLDCAAFDYAVCEISILTDVSSTCQWGIILPFRKIGPHFGCWAAVVLPSSSWSVPALDHEVAYHARPPPVAQEPEAYGRSLFSTLGQNQRTAGIRFPAHPTEPRPGFHPGRLHTDATTTGPIFFPTVAWARSPALQGTPFGNGYLL